MSAPVMKTNPTLAQAKKAQVKRVEEQAAASIVPYEKRDAAVTNFRDLAARSTNPADIAKMRLDDIGHCLQQGECLHEHLRQKYQQPFAKEVMARWKAAKKAGAEALVKEFGHKEFNRAIPLITGLSGRQLRRIAGKPDKSCPQCGTLIKANAQEQFNCEKCGWSSVKPKTPKEPPAEADVIGRLKYDNAKLRNALAVTRNDLAVARAAIQTAEARANSNLESARIIDIPVVPAVPVTFSQKQMESEVRELRERMKADAKAADTRETELQATISKLEKDYRKLANEFGKVSRRKPSSQGTQTVEPQQ